MWTPLCTRYYTGSKRKPIRCTTQGLQIAKHGKQDTDLSATSTDFSRTGRDLGHGKRTKTKRVLTFVVLYSSSTANSSFSKPLV